MHERYRQFAVERIMIMAAPNGAHRTRADHPAMPVTACELAACAGDLLETGVSVLHLHVRDEQERHCLDAEIYRTVIRGIVRQTGGALVVQATTEAAGIYSASQQKALVRDLRPEAVSIALREYCPDDASEPEAAAFFAWLVSERIWPQYIVYSADELRRFQSLRRRGIFSSDHPSCLLVLGKHADGQRGDPADLDTFLAAPDLPDVSWAACCFGPREHEAMLSVLARGGHVRLGFENNLLLADGSPARDNAALISQFTTAASQCSERRPATADEVRNVFIGG